MKKNDGYLVDLDISCIQIKDINYDQSYQVICYAKDQKKIYFEYARTDVNLLITYLKPQMGSN